MNKPFYTLLMNSPTNKVVGLAQKDGDVTYRLIVWMVAWDDFVLNVEDYVTEEQTTYRMYYGDYHNLERLLNYFELPITSDAWQHL